MTERVRRWPQGGARLKKEFRALKQTPWVEEGPCSQKVSRQNNAKEVIYKVMLRCLETSSGKAESELDIGDSMTGGLQT